MYLKKINDPLKSFVSIKAQSSICFNIFIHSFIPFPFVAFTMDKVDGTQLRTVISSFLYLKFWAQSNLQG